MKVGRGVYTASLILLFMVGTIHCAGPKTQVAKGKTAPAPSQDAKEVGKADSRGGAPGAAKETPQSGPQDPAREGLQGARPTAPSESPQPQRSLVKEDPTGQKAERAAEPPRPAPVPVMPTAPPSAMAPPGAAAPPPMVIPPGGVPPRVGPPVMGAPQPVDAGRSSRFVLNFDNADIYEVIRVMAEMMGINYIVDPRVKGVVNIRTTGQISNKDIFPVLQTILRMNGATAVQKGIVYEIVPFGDAKKMSGRPVTDKDRGRSQDNEKYTIQIIALKYVPAPEVTKMIKPFLSDGADIVEHPQYNLIIVGDVASNIQKIQDIIDLFDVDIFAEMRVRIYPIYNSDASELAKEMERIFTSFEVSLKSGRGVGITFTPIVRINSLLVVSSIPGIFEKVERWVKELDRLPGEGTRLSVFVYYVQNGKAKDLAEVLKQVYVPLRTTTRTDTRTTPTTPTTTLMPGVSPTPARGQRPTPALSPGGEGHAPSSMAGEGGGVPEGEINIVVDETTNCLIIRAFQRDYRAIVETIKKLDIYPKQVLIEVLQAPRSTPVWGKYPAF
jgi:type II secretory pathway component GspD/PulD (secretin)